MSKKRLVVLLSLLFFYLTGAVFSETIVLKSGKKIEGKITEKADDYIKIDYYEVPLTFYLKDIDEIDGEKVVTAPASEPVVSIPEEPTESIPSVPEGKDVPIPHRALLWKVKSKTATAYILGSIHLAKRNIYPLDKKIDAAFNASSVLVLETSFKGEDFFSSLKTMAQNSMYPPDTSLEDHVSPETYELTKKALKDMGADIQQMAMFKPWFLAMNLPNMKYMKLGYSAYYGIENYFMMKAKDSKTLMGLETAEQQIKLFSEMSDEEQDKLLFYSLIDIDNTEKNISDLVKVWRSGDEQALDLMNRQLLLQYPELASMHKKVIYDRSRFMALKINDLLKGTGTYFVIVGAAHTVGKDGIIEILKSRGFSAERL